MTRQEQETKRQEWIEEKTGLKIGQQVFVLGKVKTITDIITYGNEWLLSLDSAQVFTPIHLIKNTK